MPERLRRLGDLQERWPIYFVTACTARRRNLLANEFVHSAFRSFGESGSTAGAWIGNYILMPDHFHVFVVIDDRETTLSAWMKALKGTLSSKLREHASLPPFWQKGFFDHVLRSSDSYSGKWAYVRENAMRAGLVPCAEEWPYIGRIFDLEFRKQEG
jgi:putative transposase